MKKLLLFFTFLTFWLVPFHNVYATSATLKLSPSFGTYKVGDTFETKIDLDTGGARTSGTDVYLFYDSDKLEAQEILEGILYDMYVGENIEKGTGKISLSGLVSSSDNLFSGSGVFATVRFKVLNAGTAKVDFDFTPGGRNDCNVADFDAQEDALGSVVDGSYTISGGALAATPTPTPKPIIGVPQAQAAELPDTANIVPTLALALLGILSLGIGFASLLPSLFK